MYSRLAPAFLTFDRLQRQSKNQQHVSSRSLDSFPISTIGFDQHCQSFFVLWQLIRCRAPLFHALRFAYKPYNMYDATHTSIDAQRRTQIASLATKTAKEIKQKRGPKVPSEHKTKCQTRIEEMQSARSNEYIQLRGKRVPRWSRDYSMQRSRHTTYRLQLTLCVRICVRYTQT